MSSSVTWISLDPGMHIDLSSCKACEACRFLIMLAFWMSLLKRLRDGLITSESRRASTEMLVLLLGGLDLVMGFCLVF